MPSAPVHPSGVPVAFWHAVLAVLLLASAPLGGAEAAASRPNILVIFGDDVGWANLSLYNPGVMGYRTPNIDRIGREGVMFTDHYAQPSCTAGRAAFITGQYPIRSGLTTVGTPGNTLGLKAVTPTLAEVLKPLGYATGQFGKNHLGDRNEHLPTVHGFDEFYGNLYHLNTEENPEQVDYPQDPAFRQKFGPRGVLKCVATDVDDPTEDPRFGRMGKQRCTDTGPLTRKRMETVDTEFINGSLDFIRRAESNGQPFFVWLNTSRMHMFTHLDPMTDTSQPGTPPKRTCTAAAWSSTTGRWARSSTHWRGSVCWTTRSSSTRPTTVPSTARAGTAGRRRSAAKR